MKHITILASLLFLASCQGLTGQLEAQEDIKVIHSTVFGNNKTKTIKAGNYQAKLSTTAGKKIKVVLNNDIKFKIKVPSNIDLSRSGEINLKANRTGQKYDMLGFINRVNHDGPEQYGYEHCTYEERRYVCDRDNRCRWVNVRRNGNQRVRYFIRTTEIDGYLDFIRPNSNETVASFDGDTRFSQRYYTYKGRCR